MMVYFLEVSLTKYLLQNNINSLVLSPISVPITEPKHIKIKLKSSILKDRCINTCIGSRNKYLVPQSGAKTPNNPPKIIPVYLNPNLTHDSLIFFIEPISFLMSCDEQREQ